ncbi:MAG: alpha/beta hydrolase [Anaerolineales bacterium]|nr:alpha/beta hydrolase [Anaerolineales bacterium]
MKLIKKIFLISAIAAIMLTGAMLAWSVSSIRHAETETEEFLQSSTTVLVEDTQWLSFHPQNQSPKVGFIFYPGGNVDYRAYAPTLYRIAEAGFLVVDVAMPLNLAVLGASKASKVINTYPEIENWVIGGHSLGGSMASRFVDLNPGSVDGLALWASYPAESNSLADAAVEVLSIYATLDGLATVAKIERAIPLLPEDTHYFPIQGGNHAQFGFYGTQEADMAAMISRESQQDQIVEVMVAFLEGFE